MNLSVIGLGKLGSPLLAVLAEAGHHVIGADINDVPVNLLNAGKAPVREPMLQDYLDRSTVRYAATTDIAAAVRQSEATFVIVPTPTGEDDAFVLDHCIEAFEVIGQTLREKGPGHLVILVSTVMPGDTARLCAVLERESGMKHGEGFGLVYNPEFIALGNVIKGITEPDYVLIGSENPVHANTLEDIYQTIISDTRDGAIFKRMNWVSAEIAKIAQNAYVTMKITFANQLGQLCAEIPGANVDDITTALGQDQRIGPKFLTAGTAYGGPCFPRDNRAFRVAGKRVKVNLELPALVDDLNLDHSVWLADLIEDVTLPGDVVAIVGAAYKPGTPVCEESASLKLAEWLYDRYHVALFDEPDTLQDAMGYLGGKVTYHNAPQGNILFPPEWERVTLVWMYPVKPRNSVQVMQPSIQAIVDPWRMLTTFANLPGYVGAVWNTALLVEP